MFYRPLKTGGGNVRGERPRKRDVYRGNIRLSWQQVHWRYDRVLSLPGLSERSELIQSHWSKARFHEEFRHGIEQCGKSAAKDRAAFDRSYSVGLVTKPTILHMSIWLY